MRKYNKTFFFFFFRSRFWFGRYRITYVRNKPRIMYIRSETHSKYSYAYRISLRFSQKNGRRIFIFDFHSQETYDFRSSFRSRWLYERTRFRSVSIWLPWKMPVKITARSAVDVFENKIIIDILETFGTLKIISSHLIFSVKIKKKEKSFQIKIHINYNDPLTSILQLKIIRKSIMIQRTIKIRFITR